MEEGSNVRPLKRVDELLASKPDTPFTMPKSMKVEDAISFLVKHKLSSCLALEKDGTIAGVFTARDLLRFMDKVGEMDHSGKASAFKKTVADLMTKRDKMLYCSPKDTLRQCRQIMFQVKIRNMPVIDKGEVVGIVTLKDIADSYFNLSETGGKKGFINNIKGRKGLPDGIKLTELKSSSVGRTQQLLDYEVGSSALPHPYKTRDNVSSSRRQHGLQNEVKSRSNFTPEVSQLNQDFYPSCRTTSLSAKMPTSPSPSRPPGELSRVYFFPGTVTT